MTEYTIHIKQGKTAFYWTTIAGVSKCLHFLLFSLFLGHKSSIIRVRGRVSGPVKCSSPYDQKVSILTTEQSLQQLNCVKITADSAKK